MKVSMHTTKQVELKSGEESLGIFETSSSWEGLTKFENEHGYVIVKTDNFFADIWEGIFNSDKPKEGDVVLISPCLIPANLKAIKNDKEKVTNEI
jgi:hypothetical protein